MEELNPFNIEKRQHLSTLKAGHHCELDIGINGINIILVGTLLNLSSLSSPAV